MNHLEIEEQLIESYNTVSKEIRELKYFQKFAFKGLSEDQLLRLNELYVEKNFLAESLSNLQEIPITLKKIKTLSHQLQAIIENLKIGDYGQRILRDQALILEGAIYFYIVRDIEDVLTNKYGSWHIPNYFYSNDSNFDHLPVKEILINFNDALLQYQPSNFIHFEELVIFYIDKINEIAEKDCQENKPAY